MDIVIVGGGTAGWIASYILLKSQPGLHKITLIESSQIGIVGAGEGSTGLLRDILVGEFFDYRVNIDEFMLKTKSTRKYGIRHENWIGDGSSYFAPIDVSNSAWILNDYIFKYSLANNRKEKMHVASYLGSLYENNEYDNDFTAFHFDAFKIGNFFKEICLRDNATCIDAIVNDITLNADGDIKSIILDSGQIIHGDFFVDCSGFRRILANKLNISWISKSKVLPMNTAMPFLLEYKENERIIPETKATALSSGWMWNIPLTTRRGCGYVFDRNFISNDQAKIEIENYLGHSIEPIRFIEFDAGYVSDFWKNNLLILGLASSFVEPLEATSIHNTIAQMIVFVKEFLLKDKATTVTRINQKIYNKRITFLNDITIDFISLHYQGKRNDSDFWKFIKEKNIITDTAKDILEKAKYKIPGFVTMEGMWGSASIPLFNWILAGMDVISPEQAARDLCEDRSYEKAQREYNKFVSQFEKRTEKKYITKIKE
jgi:hypothetical protein